MYRRTSPTELQCRRHTLHEAVKDNNSLLVEYLLWVDADPNFYMKCEGFPHPCTALHVASWYNFGYIAGLLLDAGANVDAKLISGETPLHYALSRDHPLMVEALLSYGANPNIAIQLNVNLSLSVRAEPLFVALEHSDTYSVQMLLKYGAKVDIVNYNKESPLRVAILRFQDASERYIVCKDLLAKGALVNHRDPSGLTPILLALKHRGDAKLAELFIQRGADVSVSDPRGGTALHIATRGNCMKLVKKLLDAGANPNVLDCHGKSVIAEAVYRKFEKMVELLVQHGAVR